MKSITFTLCVAAMMVSAQSSFGAGCGPGGCGQSLSGCGGTSCMSSCQACGGLGGICCGLAEAIDIESLTPEAQSKDLYDALQARLIFTLPEDADVYLSGQKMTTAGAERTFLVSVNNPESIYKYDIRVEVVRGGKLYYRKHTMKILRAGAIIGVTIDSPPVEDGEIPVIAMEVAPIMPGGAPPAEPAVSALEAAAAAILPLLN